MSDSSESIALLHHMIHHNAHHTSEISELIPDIEDAEAQKALNEAVQLFQEGNEKLQTALTLLEKK